MFCPKCGAQALNGAQFCQNCGAKLISDASSQPTIEVTADSIQKPGNVLTDVPKKKKSKKPLIIVAVVVAFIAILIAANADNLEKRGEQAAKDEEYINSQQQSSENSGGHLADTTGQMFICDIPVQDVMNMSAEGVIAAFGEPDVYEPDVYYDGDRIEYESDQLCFIMSENGGVFCLDAPAEKFMLNGQNLNLCFDDLVSLLGDDYYSLGRLSRRDYSRFLA